ncbi:hypothetical protein [Lentibacillus sp. CBA3610]|uniref:hypothetical protein n=1 Tax=Lentibacillus sp. CBA3610 TaxID=2518176 RepID=UPI0015958DB5|nr:hypothetical protein [Lentibacillus sp. CBA3610]QKY71061.1 hypothetical protein Len3610_17175 [Lentibacillus sp. CBA3610]
MMPLSLLLIIGLLVFAAVLFTPKKRQNNSYVKTVQWAFGIYIAVLLLSVPVVYLLPEGSGLSADVENAPSEFPSLLKLADNGDIEHTGHVYQQETWEVQVENQEVQLTMSEVNGSHARLPIYVEHVSNQQDMIEAAYYQTPFIVEGFDMSNRLGSLDIGFGNESGRLNIYPPGQTRIDLSMFKQEFPIAQLTGERGMENVYTNSDQLLYLKVPEDMALNYHDHIEVYYHNENQ